MQGVLCRILFVLQHEKKSKSMVFGDSYSSLKPLPIVLNGQPIEYVSEWTCLGCLIQTDKRFCFSCKDDLRSFRSSANSILSAVKKRNEVIMQLLYSICVPILSYASEVKQFSDAQMHECHVALNDAICRVFGYNRWESVRSLRLEFGYDDMYTIFAKRRKNFDSQLSVMKNETINSLNRFLISQLLV